MNTEHMDPRLNGKVIPTTGRVQVDASALGELFHQRDEMLAALAEFIRIDDEDTIGLQCASGSDLVLALDAARAALARIKGAA